MSLNLEATLINIIFNMVDVLNGYSHFDHRSETKNDPTIKPNMSIDLNPHII